MRYFIFLFLTASFQAWAQTPKVPSKMSFAGMTLAIREDARKEIQKDVDVLTQSPKYFNIKVERAKTYFPLIEKIFREEELPDDFKYLVLQESALIPDAVSVSKAVGFWQFKDFTAIEMGLRVDREVDERMNIISSSRAAARYIKKNNYTFFNNWLYALQAYQMGAGGVMKAVSDSKPGATHMEITGKTYWYVKKFLAHKVAFEDALHGTGQVQLMAHETKGKVTLREIAKELSLEEAELKDLNKWLKSSTIPNDKQYAVLFPVTEKTREQYLAAYPPQPEKKNIRDNHVKINPVPVAKASQSDRIKINGVTAVKGKPGETVTVFASRNGVDLSYFLKCNDLTISDRIDPDKYYFLSKKRNRARQAYHTVTGDETLWDVSQRYGVQMRKLKQFNRLSRETKVENGTVLYLSSAKPRNKKTVEIPVDVVEVSTGDTFNWSAEAKEPATQETATEIPENASAQQTSVVIAPVVEDAVAVEEEEVNTLTSDTSETAPADSGNVGLTISVTPPEGNITVIPKTQRPKQHMVKAGETLYAIAKQYEVEVMDIVHWNNLDLQEGIKPNQVLKLEGSKYEEMAKMTPASAEIVHVVIASDTLYSIARKYGVTIKELMDWNGKTDFAISQGEKLRVIQQ